MPSRSPFFHVAYIPICCLHSRWLILLTISCMQQLLDLWSCDNGLLKHVACLPTSNIFNIWFEYVRIPPIERLSPRIGYLSVFFNGYSVFISIFPAFSLLTSFFHIVSTLLFGDLWPGWTLPTCGVDGNQKGVPPWQIIQYLTHA